jgi:Protoglobin
MVMGMGCSRWVSCCVFFTSVNSGFAYQFASLRAFHQIDITSSTCFPSARHIVHFIMSKMQHIDPSSLSHLPSRIQYLHSFLTFDPSTDGPLIISLKPLLAPLLPTLLDALYTHLLSYDITARSFLPSQTDAGPAPGVEEKDVSALNLNHANIKHRKDFLRAYLIRLLNNHDWTPESRFWDYLDNVGRVHTGRQHTSRKNMLRVEYVHIALLLGWLQDVVVGVVMNVKEDEGDEGWTLDRKVEVLRALGKFWWVQNDLFARHYCEDWDLMKANEKPSDWLQKPVVQMAAVGVAGMMTGAILVALLL